MFLPAPSRADMWPCYRMHLAVKLMRSLALKVSFSGRSTVDDDDAAATETASQQTQPIMMLSHSRRDIAAALLNDDVQRLHKRCSSSLGSMTIRHTQNTFSPGDTKIYDYVDRPRKGPGRSPDDTIAVTPTSPAVTSSRTAVETPKVVVFLRFHKLMSVAVPEMTHRRPRV